MMALLIYDLKVAVLIAVFYMFYRLLLAHETFHRINRVVLLLTAIASFLLPFCVITMHETVTMAMPETDLLEMNKLSVAGTPTEEPSQPLWQMALPIIYIIGVLTVSVRIVMGIARVLTLIHQSECHPQSDGTTIAVTTEQLSPFSFFSYIVLSQKDYEEQNAAILTHERGHIHEHHSVDVILVDTLTALQWFNPAMWMLRQDLRQIHEYEADAAVLSQGINARQYQYLLVSKAAGIGGYSIANGISHSTLKNRIHMMQNNNKHNNKLSLLKLLALVPIVGATLVLNAETVQDVVYIETNQQSDKREMPTEQVTSLAPVQVAENETATVADNKTVEITGIVTAKEDGKPIIGAVVRIEGSTLGTVTDMDGRYRMKVKDGDRITFSYVGMGSVTAKVTANRSVTAPIKMDIELQKDGSDKSATYDVVEQMPQFPGGMGAMMRYLAQNVRYPQEAQKAGVQGRVVVTFIVEKDGTISNAKVVRKISEELDAEALRVVNTMPKWQPGMQNGKAVAVKYTIPITFSLQGKETPNSGDSEMKANAPEVVAVGKNTDAWSEDKVQVVVDGIEMDMDKFKLLFKPENIKEMSIEKSTEGQTKRRIIVTTKQGANHKNK